MKIGRPVHEHQRERELALEREGEREREGEHLREPHHRLIERASGWIQQERTAVYPGDEPTS